MCREAGLDPLNSVFSAPREGTLRPVRSTRMRALPPRRSSDALQPSVRWLCLAGGGPSTGSGSVEGWCGDMRRPLGEPIPRSRQPAGERHEDQVRAQWFPQRVTGSGLR